MKKTEANGGGEYWGLIFSLEFFAKLETRRRTKAANEKPGGRGSTAGLARIHKNARVRGCLGRKVQGTFLKEKNSRRDCTEQFGVVGGGGGERRGEDDGALSSAGKRDKRLGRRRKWYWGGGKG